MTRGCIARVHRHSNNVDVAFVPFSSLQRLRVNPCKSAWISIALDGSQLSAQLTGQQKFPIYAESDTLFFFKVVDASIEFDKGARRAGSLTLRQNGRETKATRKD